MLTLTPPLDVFNVIRFQGLAARCNYFAADGLGCVFAQLGYRAGDPESQEARETPSRPTEVGVAVSASGRRL